MKIAVCAEESHPNAPVHQCISRSPYFVLTETDTGEFNAVKNPAVRSDGHGGKVAAEALIGWAVDAVITPHCGDNAHQLLTKWGVAVYKSPTGIVREIVEDFKIGLLTKAPTGDACDHGHGHHPCRRKHGKLVL